MSRIGFTIVIARPVEQVFAVLTDVELTPLWSSSADREWWTTPPITVGSRRVSRGRMLGRHVENKAELTEFESGRTWTMSSRTGPQFDVSARFEATNEGTRVDWTGTFGDGGISGLAISALAPVFWRRFATDLGRLERLMETGQL